MLTLMEKRHGRAIPGVHKERAAVHAGCIGNPHAVPNGHKNAVHEDVPSRTLKGVPAVHEAETKRRRAKI